MGVINLCNNVKMVCWWAIPLISEFFKVCVEQFVAFSPEHATPHEPQNNEVK